MTPRTCTACGAKLRANARALVCQPCSEATGAEWLADVEALAVAEFVDELGDGTAPYLAGMCPDRGTAPMQALARSIRADAATRPPDPARDWVRAVESIVDDSYPPAPSPPVDELSDMIREDGGLDETPALALLDEIQRLRKATADE